MNFLEIRTQIGNELQHQPDAALHRADMRGVVNRVLKDLITMHPWTFRWQKVRFATYADLRVSAADWDLVDTRTVGTEFPAAAFDLGVDRLLYGLQGNFAVYVGPTTYGARRFVIERASNNGADQVCNLTLDPRWAAAGKAPEGAWTIRFERIPLPADCMGVLGVAQIDAATGEVRPLGFWSPTDNQGLLRVNPDDQGPSQMWLLDIPGFSGPTNQTLSLPALGQGTPYYGGGEPDLPRPPAKAPTLVQAAAGTGYLLTGVEYEVGYTWAYGNRESGMSPTAKITMSTTTHMGIDISGLERMPDSLYGRNRVIYVRETDLGRWRRVTELADPAGTTFSYLGQSSFDPLLDDVRWEDEPCNEWIRLYPRPQDYMEHELTYLRRPRLLQRDEDSPEFPPEFHHILVHAALLDLQARHAGLKIAAVHELMYNQVLGRMRARYLETAQLQILTKGSILGLGASAFSILVPPFTVPDMEL